MDLEWQDRRLLKLLAEEGPLNASILQEPTGDAFRFDYLPTSQGGEQLGEKPAYEASRVRRLEADGLLSVTADASGQFRVEITPEGTAASREA